MGAKKIIDGVDPKKSVPVPTGGFLKKQSDHGKNSPTITLKLVRPTCKGAGWGRGTDVLWR